MKLTEEDLTELMLSTDTYKESDSDEVKQKWHDIYRRVENESIEQIKYHGSIENWYVNIDRRI